MCFRKIGQVIKFEQNLCNASVDDNEILFVRVNEIVKNAKAQFEVPFTHNAIVIKGGNEMRMYNSGSYKVFGNKDEVKKWKSGLSVEIIYIPKQTRVLIEWGTPNTFSYRDFVSGRIITVGAYGEFDVSVTNPELFFVKVVGSKKEFNLKEFKNRYSETVATEFVDIFLKVVNEKNMSCDEFAANKKEIGESVGLGLNIVFERDWGLSILNFKIANFGITDSGMSNKELQENLIELERLDVKQCEREMYIKRLELQDKNAYYDVLKALGNASGSECTKNVCLNCGYVYSSTDSFCPSCGSKIAGDKNNHI